MFTSVVGITSATFDGGSSLAMYRPNISSSTDISGLSLKLTTTILYGTFFYIAKNDIFLKLRIANQKLELNYKTTPGLSNTVSFPFIVSSGNQYHIKMGFDQGILVQIWDGNKIVAEEPKFDPEAGAAFKTMFHNNPVIAVGGVAGSALWEKAFKGCLEEVRVGGILLPFFYDRQFENYTNRETFQATSLVGVTGGCTNPGACVGNACRNGAVCTLASYSYSCHCNAFYAGPFCEIPNHCMRVTCENGGRCRPETSRCLCKPGFTGDR